MADTFFDRERAVETNKITVSDSGPDGALELLVNGKKATVTENGNVVVNNKRLSPKDEKEALAVWNEKITGAPRFGE